MSTPDFEFKYQKNPSTRSVGIAGVEISREPLVVDFSSTYPNNQEAAITVDGKAVANAEADISGVIGNFLVTDKTLPDGTFLFYEYQPKFDLASSGIVIADDSGKLVSHKIEYGGIQPSGTNPDPNVAFPLTDHKEIDYDKLTGHSDLGVPGGLIVFSPSISPAGPLGYDTHSDSLSEGIFRYDEFNGVQLPGSGTLDFTFLSKLTSALRPSILADDWNVSIGSGVVNLTVNSTTSANIPINSDTWYRGRMIYDDVDTTIEVYRESLIGSETVAESISPSGFQIDLDALFMNHMVLFNENPPAVDFGKPPVAPRYSHALRWADIPPDLSATHFRARILTETNGPMVITYDARKPDGTIEQNREEALNHRPIYEKTDTETNEWVVAGTQLLLNGPIASASTVFIKPLFEGLIGVDVVDRNLVVTDGSFKSDPFDSVLQKFSYELLEYQGLMPFETDNQNIVTPRSLKSARFKASVLGAYEIQTLPLVVFDGRYPEYLVPVTEDIIKEVSGSTVTLVSGTIDTLTWRKTRGLFVYVNGTRLPQSAIRGADEAQGRIFLNVSVNPQDNVEVTYLRRVPHFILNFPRIKGEVQTGNSWRIFIRPNYPNYFLDNPADTLERLAYKDLENGETVGPLKSCNSDEVVIEPEGTIKLADISLVPVVTISDARVFGGGLLEDDHFGGTDPRRIQYPSSIFFSDIANFQSSAPEGFSTDAIWPTVFIRIPNSVKAKVEGRFTTTELALEYIKKSIEKHLALGIYYVIIDENNLPWEKPFPSTSPRGTTKVNLEL